MTYAPLKRRESAAAKPQALKPASARTPAKPSPAPVTAEPEVQRESSVQGPDLEEDEAAAGPGHAIAEQPLASADDPPRAPSAGILGAAFIQRKCDACDQEDEEALDLQRKPLDASPSSPLPGLRVGRPDDPLEREADRFADAVVDDLARSSVRDDRGTPRPEATSASTDTLQRACDACSTELEEEELQREVLPGAASASGMTLSGSLARAVHTARGGGAPLPFGIRRALEPRFGADLGSVRVHTDGTSQRLNRQLHARAFTLGADIFFGADQFRPNDRAGQKLLAHELTHTLQQRRRSDHTLRRAPETSTRAEQDTADAVLDALLFGLPAGSAALEERVRKLSRRERQRLRDRIHGQSWEDPDFIAELLTILDNVEEGHTGATSNNPNTVPCNPGDVEPVSVEAWEDDPVLTDLELTDGTVVAQGKLGGHSPAKTITLFQRALVQWGCEVASPARNPLRTSKQGDNGVDGVYGPQFRRAVRQFQDAEGLPRSGVADPATVQRMAWWLTADDTRRERETREVEAEAAANLEAEKAATAAATAEEAAVQFVLRKLHEEGARHIGVRRPTSPALAAHLVASSISGASPEAINEALERILLIEPEFYHQILFEGKLIAALQEFGIYGLEVAAKNVPRGADFPIGFAIEAREITARDPHSTPTFSGTDIPLIATGFFVGTGLGVGKAVAENLEAIAALADPEFWVSLGKIASDAEFRYLLGRGAAEALHKKIAGILASGPYDYGVELGTLFGMLVFEFAVAVLLAGGSLPLKLANKTDDIKKAGRLQLAARYIANSATAGRVGAAAVRGFEASAAFVKRVRRLLPDITQHAKASRAVDDVAALELAIERKLKAIERSSDKRFYLHQRPSPDPEHLERLDLEIRRNEAEINELLDAYGPSNFDDAIASRRGVDDASRLTPDVPDADAGRPRVSDEIEGTRSRKADEVDGAQPRTTADGTVRARAPKVPDRRRNSGGLYEATAPDPSAQHFQSKKAVIKEVKRLLATPGLAPEMVKHLNDLRRSRLKSIAEERKALARTLRRRQREIERERAAPDFSPERERHLNGEMITLSASAVHIPKMRMEALREELEAFAQIIKNGDLSWPRATELASDELLSWTKKQDSAAGPKLDIDEIVPGHGDWLSFQNTRTNAQMDPGSHLIKLRKHPRKIEVLEEVLHHAQSMIPGFDDMFPFPVDELHVKDFMLRHREFFGISREDALVLQRLLHDQMKLVADSQGEPLRLPKSADMPLGPQTTTRGGFLDLTIDDLKKMMQEELKGEMTWRDPPRTRSVSGPT